MKLVYYETCSVSKEDAAKLAKDADLLHCDSRFWDASGVPFKNRKECSEQGVTGVCVIEGSANADKIVEAFESHECKVPCEVVKLPESHKPMHGKMVKNVPVLAAGEADPRIAALEAQNAQMMESNAVMAAQIEELLAGKSTPDSAAPKAS